MPREIFQVRSHHLLSLRYSIAEFYNGDPKKFAQREAFLSLCEIRTEPELDTENYQGIGHSYRRDVLGENDKNKWKYYKAVKSNVLKILTLPNDSIVVVSAQPDEICQSCAIGAHCDIIPDPGTGGDFLTRITLEFWLSQNGLGYKKINGGVITNMANIRKFLGIKNTPN